MTSEVVIPLEEKHKLEIKYGIHVNMDAMLLSCDLVARYANAFLCSEEEADDCRPEVLQRKAVQLLHQACARTRKGLDVNVEENRLDEAEYLLYRTLLELKEAKREKDLGTQTWIPRVEEEYKVLKDFWNGFAERWKPLKKQQGVAERAREIYIMKQLRPKLVSCLQEVEASKKRFQFDSVVLDVYSLINSTSNRFLENFSVNKFSVAEVASGMISVPASWLLNSSKPPLQGIGQRLLKRFGGQDHVVNAVASALSKWQHEKGRHCPIGSFLFFGGGPCGRGEFIEALTEELFDSKDLLIRFEMSDYKDSHIPHCDSYSDVCTRDYNHEEHGFAGELIKAVKSRPFGVLLFQDVEKADIYAIEILVDLLRHGRLTDSKGGEVDFSKSLIIMTSDVPDTLQKWWCDCLENDPNRPMIRWSIQLGHPKDHNCGFVLAYEEANKLFKRELLEELDDVVVFNGLSELQYHVVARLQLRELAEAIRPRRLIVYPSEAALRIIKRKSICLEARREGMKKWLKKKVVPVLHNMLSENKTNDGITTIYIDTLVGTHDLSYRLERSPGNFLVFKHFKESLNELRTMYQREREGAYKIYTLLLKLCEFMTRDSDEVLGHVAEVFQDFVDTVDDLIANTDLNFSCENYILASVNFLIHGVELRQLELASENSRNEADDLGEVLDSDQAVDVVAEALLRTVHGHRNTSAAKSFLILGLTSDSKADLQKGLAELCAAHEGTYVIQTNAEEHKDSDSLLQLIDGALSYNSHKKQCLGLQEAVTVRQGGIILIDQIEKADMSVFSTILSMLDHRIVEDSGGRRIDFRDTVVAIMSDSGNRQVLSCLSGHGYGDSVKRGHIKQDGRHFRTELLNWVDEILIFNPFAKNKKQLEEFSRLSMRVGPHLEGRHHLLYCAFSPLFEDTTTSYDKKWPTGPWFAVCYLAKGLIGKCGDDVLFNLKSSFAARQICMPYVSDLLGEV